MKSASAEKYLWCIIIIMICIDHLHCNTHSQHCCCVVMVFAEVAVAKIAVELNCRPIEEIS
jgi:hypothetical protein